MRMLKLMILLLLAAAVAVTGGCGEKKKSKESHNETVNLYPETPPEPSTILRHSQLAELYGSAGLKVGKTTKNNMEGWFGKPAYIDQDGKHDVWIYYFWKGEFESGYAEVYGQDTPYYQINLVFDGDTLAEYSLVDLMN